MKTCWPVGLALLFLSSGYAIADTNTPGDNVIKKQFSDRHQGLMQLEKISLRQLDAVGNRATYMVEGDMSASDNLYSLVGEAGEYLFYERTWTKGQPVKFSAMMTAVGTKDSGWKTEFFSMQTAARNAGRPFDKNEDLSKSLVVNDSNFMTQFAKIDTSFAVQKTTLSKQLEKKKTLETELASLEEQKKCAREKECVVPLEMQDKENKALDKKTDELRRQLFALGSSNRELEHDYKRWQEGVARMRKEGVIP
ncbi:DUF1202 family protein [Superficieibacter sp.]|uniref:DUF1202 family protein n=1 Tax=Superficieibacter sp. TaxID=2303322 RepID=UPI0028B00091|nr:DUF1202 family protein [Superficieibacter sp.]